MKTRITAIGHSLPANVVSNNDLAQKLDTSHDWIVERTGIHQRHIAAEGETTSDLAAAAANEAIKKAGIKADEINLIIVATATPDKTMPATATLVQAKIGATGAAAFDLHAACSGFVYALTVADAMLRGNGGRYALVIGAETFSRVLDWEDRGSCVLFGDGAGAVILKAEEGNRGILASRLSADGSLADILGTDGGVSTTQTAGKLKMNGREVFKHAVNKMADILAETITASGVKASDIALVVPHQANRRILDACADKLGIASDKVMITLDKHANTSAASIPLALYEAEKQGLLGAEKIVALVALGAGLTWGACIIRW